MLAKNWCAMALIAFVGCGAPDAESTKQTLTTEGERQGSSGKPDPVSQLKAIIREDALPAKWDWMETTVCTVRREDISYDVRQTNSLVSPYVGEIRFVVQIIDDKRMPTSLNNFVRKYVYQEGQWVADQTWYGVERDGKVYEIKQPLPFDRVVFSQASQFLAQ